MRRTLLLVLLVGVLPEVAAVQSQPIPRDTILVLERSGQLERNEDSGKVLFVRLERPEARVVAGASYRVIRLRLAWQGVTGTVRMRAVVPAELQHLFSPSSQPPR